MGKKSVTVLGGGLVGSAIAADLKESFAVTVVDISRQALDLIESRHGIKTIRADLSDRIELREAVAGTDIVVGALPGSMGYDMIATLAGEKKDIVDISFFPEDPLELDGLARENGITVVTDCGVAPGMGNIILGYHNKKMEVESYECYVGGLPVVREWPWQYRAVFSPIDVIEEYTRPARYVENGHEVVREALSDPQLLSFEGIGSLEAWNSDGLRTLLRTMKIPNMIEKTLRYPGCIEYLRVLREAGFFSYETVEAGGVTIRPIDLTARLLFPQWEMKEGEEDFTVMRIIVKGREYGEKEPGEGNNGAMEQGRDDGAVPDGTLNRGAMKEHVWELHDRYDRVTGTTSMARTTGYTCTAAVHLLANGMFGRKGICPPEYLGEDERVFGFILDHLEKRGVRYIRSG